MFIILLIAGTLGVAYYWSTVFDTVESIMDFVWSSFGLVIGSFFFITFIRWVFT